MDISYTKRHLNTETGERVEINYGDGFNVYGDESPLFPSRLFEACCDGRLYEYGADGKLGDVRWEWVTEPEGSE
jgi:hypothetical protein